MLLASNGMPYPKKMPSFKPPSQWRSKGGQVGACALGRRPWDRNSTLFIVILSVLLSRDLD